MRTILIIIGILVASSTFAHSHPGVHTKRTRVVVVKKQKHVKRKVWIPGHWSRTHRGVRVWVAGHWRRV